MSTLFGIKIEQEFGIRTIEIARRTNGGSIIWLNELAKMLPDETEVIPLDNSAQGIHTIGDLKKKHDENLLNISRSTNR